MNILIKKTAFDVTCYQSKTFTEIEFIFSWMSLSLRSVYNMLHYIRITLHVELHKCHVEEEKFRVPRR